MQQCTNAVTAVRWQNGEVDQYPGILQRGMIEADVRGYFVVPPLARQRLRAEAHADYLVIQKRHVAAKAGIACVARDKATNLLLVCGPCRDIDLHRSIQIGRSGIKRDQRELVPGNVVIHGKSLLFAYYASENGLSSLYYWPTGGYNPCNKKRKDMACQLIMTSITV